MNLRKSYWLLPILVLSYVLFLTASIPDVSTGTWQTWNNMGDVRSGAAAVLLQDGGVLIIGGTNANGPVASADLFGTDGNFSAAAAMQTPRSGHTATVLSDGRVLVTGGVTSGGGAVNTAEIYDPSANSWSAPATTVDARAGHTASLLSDGRVLLAGGHDSAGNALSSLEIFDPASGKFSSAGAMSVPRMNHAAATLGDGRVLIIGGTADGTNALASIDIYDPSAGTVSAGPVLSTPRMSATATTTLDGKVVVIGGNNGTASGSQDLASAEIFDPATGQLSPSASSLVTARSGHQAFLLPKNNAILVLGGSSSGTDLNSAELYYSWADSFHSTGAMSVARPGLTGSALSMDGRFLAAGGTGLASTELYGFATVKTDAADYAPGSIVTITGGGWQPGETVTLTLRESPLIDTPPTMTAVADANGNISNNQFSPDSYDVNVRFYLTAVGNQSGWQAQNTFTDASPDDTSMTVSCSPNPVSVNNATTCKATVTNTNNPLHNGYPEGNVKFSLTGVSGVAGTWSPSDTCTLAQIGSTVSSNCTANFTPTASGTATVKGQYNASPNNWSNNNATDPTTLTVNAFVSTTTTVSSSPNPSTYGQSVTFTAAVSPNSGTTIPTGSVAFVIDGASPVAGTPSTCPVSAPANSLCTTYSTSALTVNGGTAHSVQANYTHTGNFVDSNGTLSGGQTVNKAALTITAGSYSGVYDGSSHALSDCSVSANFDNLTCTNSPAGPVGPDFGSGTVTPVVSGSTSNYSVTTNNGSWSISALAVTLTGGSYGPAAYDGSAHAPSACSSSAPTFVTCTNSPSPVGPDFGSGAVSPTPVYGKGNSTDYSFTSNNGSWSITALTVTVTGGGYGPADYDGSTHPLSACTSSASTFVTCTNNPAGPVGPDVGSGSVAPVTHLVSGTAADYNITPNNGSWQITQAPSTTLVTFESGPYVYRGTAFTATASVTGAGGLNQSLTVTYSGDCTNVTSTNGCTASASYAGDTNHKPSNDSKSITITSLAVTLTAGSYGPADYDGSTHPLSACTSSASTFVTCTNNPAGPVGPDVGSGSVAPVTHLVSGTAADYNITPNNGSWQITQAPSTTLVTFESGPYVYRGTAFTATASVTGAGGLNQSLTVTYSGDCTNVTSTNGCTASASYAGDTNHKPSNDSKSITITSLAVTLTAGSYGPADYDGSTHPLSACTSSASTFVTCTNEPAGPVGPDVGSGSVAPVTHLVSGTAADYNITPNSGSWQITQAPSTTLVTFESGPYVYRGTAFTATASVTGAGGLNQSLTVTYSGDCTNVTSTNGCTASASYAGDTNHKPSNDSKSITITSLAVTLTAGSYGPADYDGSTHPLSACTSSASTFVTCTNNPAGPVGPDVGSGSVAPVTHLVSGTAADYNITPNSGSWQITRAPSTTLVTFESGPYVYRGTAFTATASVTGAGGLNQSLTVTYSGDCTNVTSTNGCTASASYAGDTNHKPSNDSKSITITKANAAITVTPYSVAYNGAAHTATGTAKGVLNESLSGLNLSGTTHTNPGDYMTDPWTFTDVTGNYNNTSGTVHDSIGYGACSVGAGDVILPPINSDGTSVYSRKGGSTIPVKFNVCGANGAPLTDPTLVFAPTGGALTMTGALRGTITVVNEDANTDIPDAAFTWDGQQWHFNMATMNLNSGFTYTFTINLAYAPASIHFVVGVK